MKITKRPLSYRSIAALGFLSALLFLSACSKAITQQDRERAIAQTTSELLSHHGSLNDARISRYISSVMARLERATQGAPTLMKLDDKVAVDSWQVFVLESAEENVFSISSGLLFISKGMLQRVSAESELAAILAHEMAHEYLGHHAEALDTALRSESNAVFHFDLEEEIAADLISVEMLAVAGYDIRGAASAIATLYDDTRKSSVALDKGWREKRVEELLDKIEENVPDTRRITTTRAFHRMQSQLKKRG